MGILTSPAIIRACDIVPRMRRFLMLSTAMLLVASSSAWAQSDDPEPAPRFHAKTLTGETYNNASVKGKVVLLEFWTTWCPYCKEEEPLVDAVDHEFSSKGLVVLAVDVAESKKTVNNYLRDHPRTCRIVIKSIAKATSPQSSAGLEERKPCGDCCRGLGWGRGSSRHRARCHAL